MRVLVGHLEQMVVTVVEGGVTRLDGQGAINVHGPAVEGTAVERTAPDGAVGITLHALGIHGRIASREHHIEFTASEQERLSHVHALGIIASALDVERAARHGDVVIGLHACSTCRFLITQAVGPKLGCAAVDDGGAAASDVNQAVTVETLSAIGSNFHVDDSALDIDIVLGLDTMATSAVQVQFGTRAHHHIVIAVDATLTRAVDVELALAADQDLALTEECRLLVLAFNHVVNLTVAQGVDGAFLEYHIQRLAALVVDGGAMGIGDVRAIEQQLELALAVELERTVGRAARDDVAHTPGGAGDGHMGTLDGDKGRGRFTGHGSRVSIKVDVHGRAPGGVLDIVAIVECRHSRVPPHPRGWSRQALPVHCSPARFPWE